MLDKISQFKAFSYHEDFSAHLGVKESKKRMWGFSAQEVQKVFPELTPPAPFNNEYLTIDYTRMVPLLHSGLMETWDEVKHLKKRIKELEEKLNGLTR